MRELRRRQIRSILITACIFAVLAAAIGVLVSAGLFWQAHTHKGWLVHVVPDTLVQSSQHIVVARYQEEVVHEVPNSSLYPDAPTSFTDVYRRFEVLESLKGDFETGDAVYVGWNSGYTITNSDTGEPEFRAGEVPPISENAHYALFLNWLWSRSRHPDDPQTRDLANSAGSGFCPDGRRGPPLISDQQLLPGGVGGPGFGTCSRVRRTVRTDNQRCEGTDDC